MIKKSLIVIIVIILMLSVVGCSDSDELSNENLDNDNQEEKTVINFFHRWPNEPRNSFYNEKVEEYMAMNPNIEIKVDSVVNDSYKEKIRVLISSDDLPDIFCSWSDSFAKNLVGSERIQTLDEILESDSNWKNSFIESQFSGFTFDDKIYGVPFTIDGKAFFYNKEIFEANDLNAPKTYDELIVALEVLRNKGYEIPIVEGLKDKWAISHYLGTIFQRVVNPEVLEKDFKNATAEYTNEGYIKGLEMFQELTQYMGDVSTAITHEEARNMFSNGEAPIIYMQFAEIKLVEDVSDIEFGFFDFPIVKDGKGDQKALTGAPEGWMISKNAPKETVDFLKFLTSEETAYEFTEVDGQMTAIKGAVDENNTSPNILEAYEIVLEASSTIPWFDNAIDYKIADVFMRGGQSLAIGDKNPEEVLEEVQDEASKLKE